MGRYGIAGALLVGLVGVSPLNGQDLQLQAGAVELGVTGRVQVQFNSTSVSGEDAGTETEPAATTFETRRVRLAVELAVDDWITGMLEPDFAMGRLQLRQVWLQLGFSDAFALRAGQWKKPFSLIQLTSSSQIPMIERSVRIRGLTDALEAQDVAGVLTSYRGTPLLGEEQYLLEVLGYDAFDLGAAVRGTLGSFGYEVGVFNGTGSDRADENAGKSFAGRVTYELPVGVPLTLGLGASRRDHVRTVSDVSVTENGTAYELDLELGGYRQPGVWLLAEGAAGSNLVGEDFRAAQAVAAYYVPTGQERVEGVEPVFRWSWGDPNTAVDEDAGMLLTPGLNLHFHGRNQLMLNWDWYLPQGDVFDTHHALRAQAQLYF